MCSNFDKNYKNNNDCSPCSSPCAARCGSSKSASHPRSSPKHSGKCKDCCGCCCCRCSYCCQCSCCCCCESCRSSKSSRNVNTSVSAKNLKHTSAGSNYNLHGDDDLEEIFMDSHLRPSKHPYKNIKHEDASHSLKPTPTELWVMAQEQLHRGSSRAFGFRQGRNKTSSRAALDGEEGNTTGNLHNNCRDDAVELPAIIKFIMDGKSPAGRFGALGKGFQDKCKQQGGSNNSEKIVMECVSVRASRVQQALEEFGNEALRTGRSSNNNNPNNNNNNNSRNKNSSDDHPKTNSNNNNNSRNKNSSDDHPKTNSNNNNNSRNENSSDDHPKTNSNNNNNSSNNKSTNKNSWDNQPKNNNSKNNNTNNKKQFNGGISKRPYTNVTQRDLANVATATESSKNERIHYGSPKHRKFKSNRQGFLTVTRVPEVQLPFRISRDEEDTDLILSPQSPQNGGQPGESGFSNPPSGMQPQQQLPYCMGPLGPWYCPAPPPLSLSLLQMGMNQNQQPCLLPMCPQMPHPCFNFVTVPPPLSQQAGNSRAVEGSSENNTNNGLSNFNQFAATGTGPSPEKPSGSIGRGVVNTPDNNAGSGQGFQRPFGSIQQDVNTSDPAGQALVARRVFQQQPFPYPGFPQVFPPGQVFPLQQQLQQMYNIPGVSPFGPNVLGAGQSSSPGKAEGNNAVSTGTSTTKIGRNHPRARKPVNSNTFFDYNDDDDARASSPSSRGRFKRSWNEESTSSSRENGGTCNGCCRPQFPKGPKDFGSKRWRKTLHATHKNDRSKCGSCGS